MSNFIFGKNVRMEFKIVLFEVYVYGRNVVKLVIFVFFWLRDVWIFVDFVLFNGIVSIRYEVVV